VAPSGCPRSGAGWQHLTLADTTRCALEELARDDGERDAFAGELDSVRGRARQRARGAAGAARGAAARPPGRQRDEFDADPALDQEWPRVGPSMTQNSGPSGRPTRTTNQGAKLLPAPSVRADPAATATVAAAREQRTATRVNVTLAERERLLDAQPSDRRPRYCHAPSTPHSSRSAACASRRPRPSAAAKS
jgi:hypothetical protein